MNQIFLAVVAFLACFSWASPLLSQPYVLPPLSVPSALGGNSSAEDLLASRTIERREVTLSLWNQIKIYAEYSQAAYCTSNDALVTGSTPRALFCPSSLECSGLSGSQIYWGIPDGASGARITSYVALDRARRQVIVAMRGSRNPGDAITDAALFAQTDISLCAGCRTGQGAFTLWNNSRNEISAAIKKLLQANPGFSLVFTGHSLGAGVATLAAADAIVNSVGFGSPASVFLYSFASPRVANVQFSNALSNTPNLFRVTHNNDEVPRQPPPSFISVTQGINRFEHYSPEYFIAGSTLPQTPTMMTKLGPDPTFTPNTNENRKGNAGFTTPPLVPGTDAFNLQHQNYLIKISGNQGVGC